MKWKRNGLALTSMQWSAFDMSKLNKPGTLTVGSNGSLSNQYINTVATAGSTSITDEVNDRIDALEKRIIYLEKLLMSKKINEMDDI